MALHVLHDKSRSAGQQHNFVKAAVSLSIVFLVGVALVVDYLWASSSSSLAYLTIAMSWAPQSNYIFEPPNATDDVEIPKIGEKISATFADLPAPSLEWEQMPTAPVPRLDGFAIQIKNLLYVFAGYGTLDYVHSHADVYNFTDNTWSERFDIPKEMANSHLGMASDGRYIYVVSGQPGPQCRGPTASTFALDTVTKKWKSLPTLPAPRYAPATQLWRGRLHVMGGSKENRYTPGVDHWSLLVKNGEAIEKQWREEVPIPRGGPHRACIVVDEKLYVIGGQEGDFMAKPGSPIFKCSRRHEVVYEDVYMLDGEMKWKILTPMPKPNSHIESSWVVLDNSIIIVGGTTEKHPVTKRMILVGEVFQFHLDTLVTFWLIAKCGWYVEHIYLTGARIQLCFLLLILQQWSIIGKLPYRIKTTLAGFWNGWLYFTSGQRDRGPDNPQPRQVVGEMWRTKLRL